MPRTHHLAIDPARPLAQQPQTGHNRGHEDIPPALEVAPDDAMERVRDGGISHG